MRNAAALLFFVALIGTLCFQRRLLEALIEAIGNFRGGPPTPKHPLPADDGPLIRRRPTKTEYSLIPGRDRKRESILLSTKRSALKFQKKSYGRNHRVTSPD